MAPGSIHSHYFTGFAKMPILRVVRLDERALPAIVIWDGVFDAGGSSPDQKWTTGANWVGDIVPQAGDDLVFPGGPAYKDTVNDFPTGTVFGNLRFTGDGFRGAYTLSGNGITLTGGIVGEPATDEFFTGSCTLRLDVTLANDQAFTTALRRLIIVTGRIDLAGHNLTIAGPALTRIEGDIVGAGNVTATGTGRVDLFGDKSFAGTTTAAGPLVVVNGTLAGPLALTAGTLNANGRVNSLTATGGSAALIARTVFGDILPGSLATGNLDFSVGSTARFELRYGSTSLYRVTGNVRLGGTLELALDSNFPGFQYRPGNHFIAIDNDGIDAAVGTFAGLPEGAVVRDGPVPLVVTYRGGDGNDVEFVALSQPAFAAGAGAGGVPVVYVYDPYGGLVRGFLAYEESFRGGVLVATADVTGDGVPDTITAPGAGGGPVVRIWDGKTGAMVRQFLAYDANFRGGISLGAVYFDTDAIAEIVTGAGAGGLPLVSVFRAQTGAELLSFFAYDQAFTGGVNVAGGERTRVVGEDAVVPGSIVTGAGPGGGPHVRIFDNVFGRPLNAGFFAYEASFRGGVRVAYDSQFDIIVTGPGAGGGPLVRGFDVQGQTRYGFNAYDENFRGGVSVAVRPIEFFGTNGVVTGPGLGGGPNVRTFFEFQGVTPRPRDAVIAFDPAFLGGVFVG